MKRALAMLLACFFCLLSLFACTPERDAGEGYTFKDDTGASVTLTETPRRVAVLFSSYAEMWTLAGGEVAVTVGESVERGFAAADTPLVDAGAGKSISHELLLAAAPDFVILSADIAAQADTATLLRSAGIPTAAFRVESFADYARVMRIFADITGEFLIAIRQLQCQTKVIQQLLGNVSTSKWAIILRTVILNFGYHLKSWIFCTQI